MLANAVNLGMTIWIARAPVASNLPLRWIATGLVLFLVCCLQGAIGNTFAFQGLLHFSDFDLSRSQLLLFGVFAFWLFGFVTDLIPPLLKTAWFSRQLCELHFWFSTVGIVMLWAGLLLAESWLIFHSGCSKKERDRLSGAIAALETLSSGASPKGTGRHKLSAAGRARIVAAQRARWGGSNGAKRNSDTGSFGNEN